MEGIADQMLAETLPINAKAAATVTTNDHLC